MLIVGSTVALAGTYEMSRLRVARTEAQLAADAAALAGASIFAINPEDHQTASTEAIRFAALNLVRGEPASLAPEDIVTVPAEGLIRVTVRASTGSGNVFQRLLWLLIGVRASSVEVSAAAEARPPAPGRGHLPAKRLRLIE
jgi:hypothetical protein